MLDRRTVVALVAATAATAAMHLAAARAAGVPFDAAAFEAAQAAGRPILVHVTAAWCGTCKAQKPVVSELLATPEFAGMAAFEVDYDTRGDVLKALAMDRQSTMIVFEGREETARPIGQTDPAIVADLLRTAL